jgi:hypothetical protein
MNEQQIDISDTEIEQAAAPIEQVEDDKVDDVEDIDSVSENDEEADEGKKSDLPKEVEKALKKKDRYNRNLLNRLRETEAKLQQLQTAQSRSTNEAPNEADFDSYPDFLKATIMHEMEQKLQGTQQKQQVDALTQEQAVIRQQQDEIISGQVEQLATSSPDFKDVVTKNMAIIDAMPEHISNLVYQIDDAVLGAYALAKEGRLQDLYYMNPQIAAAELLAARYRGNEYIKASTRKVQQSTAPKPISSLRGTRSSTKSIDSMGPDELVKRFIK